MLVSMLGSKHNSFFSFPPFMEDKRAGDLNMKMSMMESLLLCLKE
jgi:hypothetical protein